ncbi:hypothetical protein GCM10017788_40560 [Amycolatopsis acidiphila]|nr:hypothetical protein [Amycolatopsis acidiphila]GHG75529.1 hypothetical protein GCM10017788_40560 [Amycolatopsis acidiphila]
MAYPVAFSVFDLLHLGGTDLTRAPYEERRGQLDDLALATPPRTRVPDCHIGLPGAELLEIVRQRGLEGIVAKRLRSPYQPGARYRDWIKTPLRETQEMVVGGRTPGDGRRTGPLGALLLGVHDEGRLTRRPRRYRLQRPCPRRDVRPARPTRPAPAARSICRCCGSTPARPAGSNRAGGRGRTPAMDLRSPPAAPVLARSAPRPQPDEVRHA